MVWGVVLVNVVVDAVVFRQIYNHGENASKPSTSYERKERLTAER